MLKPFFYKLFSFVHKLLERPGLVFGICCVTVIMSLAVDSSLIKMWKLNKDKNLIKTKIAKIISSTEEMRKEMKKSKDPDYLAQLAVDRYDLIKNGDLVFVFTE